MEWNRAGYCISTDKSRLQLPVLHAFLKDAPWCLGIEEQTLSHAIEKSLCFGLFQQGEQIGFVRLVTDHATFAWLTDLFVLPEHRGKRLSKWLMECVMQHPSVRKLHHISLVTHDANGLYTQYGFELVQSSSQHMARRGEEKKR